MLKSNIKTGISLFFTFATLIIMILPFYIGEMINLNNFIWVCVACAFMSVCIVLTFRPIEV